MRNGGAAVSTVAADGTAVLVEAGGGERGAAGSAGAGGGRWAGPLGRPLVAVVAGLALWGSLEWAAGWWLAPVGVAALSALVRGRRVVAAAGLGALCGLALFVPLVSWSNLHTGVAPWLLLAGSQAVFVAGVAAVEAAVWPLVARWWWAAPVVSGAVWTAVEAARARVPFGGFPWGRLAFGQVESPWFRLAAVGGAPLVTFAVAAVGGGLAGVWLACRAGGWRVAPVAGSAGRSGLALALVGLLAPVGWLAPVPAGSGRSVTVAVVQGNVPRLGLDFNEQRRRVLDNHVEGTLGLARRVAAGEVPRPDLVVWPENASDIDPLVNEDAAARIDEAAAAVGVPILVGALLRGEDHVYNAGLVWVAGRGEVGRYVKRHPVPFAEYMPLRPVARLVSDKVDLLRVEFAPGRAPGVLEMGGVVVGDVICFEVAYDSIVRDVVTGGAGLIVVQTNNATFNRAEAAQQLAMVRLRAVEHGRPALMASTVGISAFVGADGGLSRATGFNTPAVIVERVRLVSGGRTVATVVGPLPEYGLICLVVGALAVALWRGARGRRSRCGGAGVSR